MEQLHRAGAGMAGGAAPGDPHGLREGAGGGPGSPKRAAKEKWNEAGEPQGVLVLLYKSQKGLMLSTAFSSFESTI